MHIDRIAELRAQAAEVELLREQAEISLVFAMKEDQAAGRLSDDDCADVYLSTRRIVTKSFAHRWNAAIPSNPSRCAAIYAAHRARRLARAVPNGPNGTYVGTTDLAYPAPMPLRGTCVVYILFDNAGLPFYGGSTQELQIRLQTHRNNKPFATWRAWPCSDRKAAYELEERLLREFKLPMNSKVTR